MKKVLIYSLLILSILSVCVPCASHTGIAHAETSLQLETNNQYLQIKNLPDFFEIKATLTDKNTFTGHDIEWKLGNDFRTSNITPEEDSSTIRIYKSEYNKIIKETTWTFTASLSTNPSISNFIKIYFVFSDAENVRLEHSGSLQMNITNVEPITLTAAYDGYPENPTIDWFIKTTSNKYEKIKFKNHKEITLKKQNDYSEIVFNPKKAGTYSFKVIVDNVLSNNNIDVNVIYKELTNIKIDMRRATNNANGYDRYVFSVSNISEYEQSFYDTSKILWKDNHGNLLQMGGMTFEYQVTETTTLGIYATYETKESNMEFIDVSVNRNKEILVFLGAAIEIIGLITMISIIVSIKREKIW